MSLKTMLALELSSLLANISPADSDAVMSLWMVRLKAITACSNGVIPMSDWQILKEESDVALEKAHSIRGS
jgi:hypothetical protein